MPDKKDNGTITKLVTVAMWSNFSAHKPAIIPAQESIIEVNIKYIIKTKKFWTLISTINQKIKIDKEQIIKALVTDAKTIDVITSVADKGAPIISTMLPITFPIKSDDEEWEKACCITCIAIKPGAKNSVKLTPKTPSLLSPIARDITSKNNIAVIILCSKRLKYGYFTWLCF